VKEFDTRTGEERNLIQVENRNYNVKTFGVSSNKQLFAVWDDQNYDEQYLRVFDSTGLQKEFFRMVGYSDGDKVGEELISAPQFSPVNDNLLMFRFLDADTQAAGLAVLDWTTGKYVYKEKGNYHSVAWAPDGTIIVSEYVFEAHSIYRLDFENREFPDWQKLFSTVNTAEYLEVNKQGTKLLFTMAGHVFHANMDGTDLVQITAPSVGYELHPTWSPDGRHITLVKEGWRYIMSADSRNLRIYPGLDTNTIRHQFVWGEASSQVYWLP